MHARVLLAALAATLLGACGPSDEPATPAGLTLASAPTILLVTLDTTRADRIGAYGHGAARTPVIDSLAERGLRFDRAYAPTPITLPSHATMLTGTLPPEHGVRDNTGYALGDDARLVSEALAERGWRTMASVGSFVLDPRFGLDQGFEHYASPRAVGASTLGAEVERRADAVVNDALAWLEGVAPDEPAYLWLHVYDPHAPYEPPAATGAPADAYDAEIAFCDAQLGRLLAALDLAGRGPLLSVVVTADHGESLGEHGEATHGVFLYEGAMRVPLIVAGPSIQAGVVDEPVGLASVAATILELAGVPVAALPQAAAPSLLAAEREPHLYLETALPWRAHGWHPLRGLVWSDGKYIQGNGPELYDLDDDPTESHDLAPANPDQVVEHAHRLARFVSAHPPLDWQRDAGLTSDEQNMLAAMGYLGGDTTPEPPWDSTLLPDPSERIEDLRLRDEALWLLREGRRLLAEGGAQAAAATLHDARQRLTDLTSRSPQDAQVVQLLGETELTLGLYPEAAETLEWHTVLVPADPLTRYNLGVCYFQMGRPDWAMTEMVRAVAL
ncbi:MAG: sulfatase-like hydrolase/transferase, partial [Planctomycetota bacterium]